MARMGRGSRPGFQSHAGSIEASKANSYAISNISFQSHAGSIEATRSKNPASRACEHFNPTLVRLRRQPLLTLANVKPNFNPTLVRLRRVRNGDDRNRIGQFQSHAGSIEAIQDMRTSSGLGSYFNPTLVRLRHLKGSTDLPALIHNFNPTLVRLRPLKPLPTPSKTSNFNPTLVRLRQGNASGWKTEIRNFNPTLVRLRPAARATTAPAAMKFQSHAGSIEARSEGHDRSGGNEISIPRWFD